MLGPEQTKKLMYASDNASHEEADEIGSVHASELGKNINVNNRS